MLYKDDVPNVEVGVEVADSFAPSGRVVPSTLRPTGPPEPSPAAPRRSTG